MGAGAGADVLAQNRTPLNSHPQFFDLNPKIDRGEVLE